MSKLGFSGKKVFVYGLGKSGYALAAALYADGAEVYAYDKKGIDFVMSSPQGQKLFDKNTVYFADEGVADFSTIDAFFKSPGISMKDEIVQRALDADLPIMGDIDLLYRREKGAMFIGITGTNGKSTTTALIGHILSEAGKKVAIGGNLGTACLNLATEQEIYVIELSSYQLETMYEAKMDVSVLLNLTPDHLDRHGSMANYLKEKMAIFNLDENAVRVIGIDSEELKMIAPSVHAKTVSVDGEQADIVVTDAGMLVEAGVDVLDLTQFSHLPGRHNWQNIACSYAALKDFVHLDTFKNGVLTFANLAHRMEKIAMYNGVTFYNDSKATNPDSAIRALESVENIFWICGGMPKDEGIKPCLTHLKNVKGAFVIGKERDEIIADLEDVVRTYDCETMENAIYTAWQQFSVSGLENACFLLSPACASWDQFNSFEHRGDAFVTLCHELIGRLQEQNG
tara:strand:+ start:192839 stop:194203 length:1365 start_codon:yes stop_codon:yes gene_type:complete